MLYLPHTHTRTHGCDCVCVFIICGFLVFPQFFAQRFEIQAVSHKLHLLGTFHFPLSFIPPFRSSLSLGHSNICILWGAEPSFNTLLAHYRSSIRFNAASLTASLTPPLRQSGSLAVCHCASPALWQCVSWSEMRPQRSPLPGRGRTRLCQ